MAELGIRLFRYSAAPYACALALLWAAPAQAESDFRLFSADTLQFTGDVRLAAADGERSWVDGGFGKLRSSGDRDGDFHLKPQLGNANLIWQPQFTWSLSATVVGTLQGGEKTEAGLSQAYLSFRPMRSDKLSFSARAGLMWPPISLEHEGADWHVKDSITPSAINSWVGEEVRPVAAEGTVAATLGGHKLRATAAIMAANDTAGTLLTFRGWALHDRVTLAFRRQPLPPLEAEYQDYQASFTNPLLDVHSGFASRPGYYAKLSWQPPVPVRIDLFRYDNRANPEDVNVGSRVGLANALQPDRRCGRIGVGRRVQGPGHGRTLENGLSARGAPLGRRPFSLRFRASDQAVRSARNNCSWGSVRSPQPRRGVGQRI